MPFLFLLDVILILAFSYIFVALCRLPALAASVVGLLVMAYATVVFAGLVGAELGFLNNPDAHVTIHALLLGGALWVWGRARYPRIEIQTLKALLERRAIRRAVRTFPELALLAGGVGVLYSIGLYLIVTVPYSSHDSMAYHLARIGYWLQYNALRPYPTYEILQASFPINSSVAMLWTILLWGTDQLAGLGQWLAVAGGSVVIFGLARLIGGSRPQAFFAGLIWPTLPVVILQSTTTLNDMIIAFLAAAATYFLLLGLRSRSYGALLLSGVSLGLGVGTKGTIFVFIPALGAAGLFFLIKCRLKCWPQLTVWAAACLTGVLLLGSYIYIFNFLTYAHPLGPHASSGAATVANPTVETVVANVARYVYQLADPTGLPQPVKNVIQPRLAQAGRRLFAALDVDENLPAATRLPPTAFTFDGSAPPIANVTEFGPPVDRSHEVIAWFGPLGFLLIMPVVIYTALFGLFKGQPERWLLAVMALIYFLGLSYLMRWSPYRGRFMAMAVVIAAPLLILFFKRGWGGGVLRWGIVLSALMVGFWSSAFNLAKPLIGPVKIWEVDRLRQQTFYGGQFDFARAIEENLPREAVVGLVGYHLWEYPLFGPEFKRTVVPLYPYPEKLDRRRLEAAAVDYLVVSEKLGYSTPRLPDNYLLLVEGRDWRIFTSQENLFEWFEWAAGDQVEPAEPDRFSLVSVEPPLTKSVAMQLQPAALERGEPVKRRPLLWLGAGEQHALQGTIWSERERFVRLVFEVLPGPARLDTRRTVAFTLLNEAGVKEEARQFDQAARLSFEVMLQAGRNEFSLVALDEAAAQPAAGADSSSLVAVRHITLRSSIDENQAEVGPNNTPLVTVAPALVGLVGIDPNARIPWPMEIDNQGSFLWLGPGDAGGVAGVFWSDAARPVVLEFHVSPGPGRKDQQRTVRLVHRNGDRVASQMETFTEPATLSFPVRFQPGRNDFQFIVLDEATVYSQVNGESRPLLVRLQHLTVKPPPESP